MKFDLKATIKETFREMMPIVRKKLADKHSVDLEDRCEVTLEVGSDLLSYLVDRSKEYDVSVAEMLELVLLTHMDKAHESVSRIKNRTSN